MYSFKQRSYDKELLDRDDIPFPDIRRNMEELDVINTRLGGHGITIRGLKSLLPAIPGTQIPSIVEIGCGGGDNLRVIRDWGKKQGREFILQGIDLNPNCIRFASERKGNEGISFVHSDYRDMKFEKKPDIIFSSLFCHHFTKEELVFMMSWMQENSTMGFFINDLHRHPLAYYSISLLTSVFSGSYLVKNDAPLSVRRGFVRKDWEEIFQSAGIPHYHCNWQWAFRWLVRYQHANGNKI
jgi:2-polyprenyl-3-methyl-5-hydroxy-6-metoxy-1,4-benzoquinol methylase